jgi:predicted Zn-dependent peptidase
LEMQETMDRLSAITPQRLTDLAGRMFSTTPMTLAALGPIDNLAAIENLGMGFVSLPEAKLAAAE